jgi:hypothetical protein
MKPRPIILTFSCRVGDDNEAIDLASMEVPGKAGVLDRPELHRRLQAVFAEISDHLAKAEL